MHLLLRTVADEMLNPTCSDDRSDDESGSGSTVEHMSDESVAEDGFDIWNVANIKKAPDDVLTADYKTIFL